PGYIQNGLSMLQDRDLLELGAVADSVRRRLHPEGIVTFINDRNINYTNICVSGCRFCAFHRTKNHAQAYVLSYEEIGRKIDEAKALGAVQILLQGGCHPSLGLDWYLGLLRYIKRNHPIHIHGFSAPEIDHISRLASLPLRRLLEVLIEAGLDSIPGGGAEVLSARVRKSISPRKVGVRRWLEVHETAHSLGIKTTATMVYGLGESPRELLGSLRHIQSLQERTGGFTAFIPWSFQPVNTKMKRKAPGTGPACYLRILALSRIILDNIPNIQASWVTQGPDIAQLALHFGANDFGSTMLEENVVRAAGCSFEVMDQGAIARLIKEAGFIPALRKQDYQIISLKV
ncbi:MAG: cyclic dehypoxanthinyl futalosine synthase, partial [Gemmatimonadota bacterium]|nr:cyclic dehypoxanthinyl futalosine synthase [Gemmatimonadota bacterium]